MKTLQKYTNIALLLISMTTIVPAYANPTVDEQEQIKQKNTETVWYKRPKVRENIETAIMALAIFPTKIIFDPMTITTNGVTYTRTAFSKYTSIVLAKYTTAGLLLLAADATAPQYANSMLNEQEQVNIDSQKIETAWYKQPEVREKISSTLTGVTLVAGMTLFEIIISLYADSKVYGFKRFKQK